MWLGYRRVTDGFGCGDYFLCIGTIGCNYSGAVKELKVGGAAEGCNYDAPNDSFECCGSHCVGVGDRQL